MRGRLLALASLLAVAAPCAAQLAPNLHWQTLMTPHFRVTFSPGLEETARRAAGSAERAYAALARELHPPRGTIDLVVADNIDDSNGYAIVAPSNRIVVYARPSIEGGALRYSPDWIDLVVTHELAHIFHLDRTRGLWRLGQYVFGRNPHLFPNTYSPSWLIEGLAVYYETKLTGAGRLAGTDFGATIRTHELFGAPPKLNALSSASPNYPLGNVAYTYGAQVIEQAARTAGPEGMKKFVESNSAWLIPFMLNTNAKRGFGIAFDSAHAVWTDSAHRAAQLALRRAPGPTPIMDRGWFSGTPRWADDSTLLFASASPSALPSLKRVGVSGGQPAVVAVRKTSGVTSPIAGGWRVFAQQDYVDPYTRRSDLFLEHSGRTWQLTRGARLMQPDARRCDAGGPPAGGEAQLTIDRLPDDAPALCIAAVEIVPGASRIVQVRVQANRVHVSPMTASSPAEHWSEPRWSRSGTQVAATHWLRGGTMEIALVGGTDAVRSLGRTRAVVGAPSWGAGDSTLFFVSDRSGRSAVYRANVQTGEIARIADSPTALEDAEVSPDGRRVATFVLRADGYNLALVDANTRGVAADSTSVLAPIHAFSVATTDAPVGKYSAWRTVLPRHWLPTADLSDEDRQTWGFRTSGSDVVGRHAWEFRAALEPERNEPSWRADYAFAGLGMPVVQAGAEELWEHLALVDSTRRRVGTLQRRRVFADGAVSFTRRRIDNLSSLAVGGSMEWRDFGVDPISLAPQLSPTLKRQYTYPSYFVSARFSNARVPSLALGPENGVSLSGTARVRWRSDAPATTRATTYSGAVTLHRAFDFGARVHHLAVLRGVAAMTDITSATELRAGGGSGGSVDIVPGVSVGESRRTFFVRGFPGGVQSGSRAVGMNAEYRFPLAFPARGLWKFPLFFQRVSGVFFADGAAAWCHAGAATSPICPRATPRTYIASAGAELHFDTALQYDSPYRFRLGAAVPTRGSASFGDTRPNVYFTVGLPF
ncbi:MAG: hypothetical protein FJ202_08670 [Gemmatimonadetes bacterium]|nr:hypothetical protein [Gemmatimonadota bacterium]